MADLTCSVVGIRSPNPFWLASAPPTDKAYNVNRAFEAGWGGVVWKTLGEDPPIVNVNGPRYGALLLSLSSVVSKTLIPGAIFPIGIVTSLIGVPFFISLILGKRRSW
jgi:hypothetical protein